MEEPKDLETQVLEWEKMEAQSLMVEVFGLGMVEVDVHELTDDDRLLLEVYVYPLGNKLKKPLPLSSMRTLMPMPEPGTEVEH